MDTKSALKSLYQIVAKQQEVLKKLAQMTGAAPASAAAAGVSEPLTKSLQSALFAAMPALRAQFVEPPTVGTSVDGKLTVFYKYHAGPQSEALKAAVKKAADSVLPAGYLVQSTGQF
jgi:hypothetical protein